MTEHHEIAPDWALELVAVTALFICVIGFLGNLLTVLALPYTSKLRNAATWFVVNLAVIEMVFCVTILPMSGAHLIYLRVSKGHLLDDNGCRLFVFLRYTLAQAELLSIAAIAMNRCILIAFPKLYRDIFTLKKSVWMIVGIWSYSSFLMAFPLFKLFGSFSYNSNTQECDFDESETTPRQVFLALGFLFPSCVVVISYSYIFYKARQSARKMRRQRADTTGSTEFVNTRPAEGLRNRDMRVARTIGVIFLAFIICCTPVSLAHFYGSHGQITTLLLMLHPLYWSQYCVNVFIYVLMNRQYREAYINYISHWWPKFRTITERAIQPGTDDETSISPQSPHINNKRKIHFGKKNAQNSCSSGSSGRSNRSKCSRI